MKKQENQVIVKKTHSHSGGGDQPRIKWTSLIKNIPLVSSAPTNSAVDGEILAYDDGVNFRLYIRINGTWRYATLT